MESYKNLLPKGVNILLGHPVFLFIIPCLDHEWHLAFKAVAGIATSADVFNPLQVWQRPEAYNENITEARQLTTIFQGHYKSSKTLSWNTLDISEVGCVIHETIFCSFLFLAG